MSSTSDTAGLKILEALGIDFENIAAATITIKPRESIKVTLVRVVHTVDEPEVTENLVVLNYDKDRIVIDKDAYAELVRTKALVDNMKGGS